ncbi:MAG TPA: hypothetical protein VFK50_05905 [Sphingomicrobium sp.]|nr:hypothetical protein [Sphingomicrobium sp.]
MAQDLFRIKVTIERNASVIAANPSHLAADAKILAMKNNLAAGRWQKRSFNQGPFRRKVAQLDRQHLAGDFKGRREQDVRAAGAPILSNAAFVHDPSIAGAGKAFV